MPIGYAKLESDVAAWYTDTIGGDGTLNGSSQDFADLWSDGYQTATLMGMAMGGLPGNAILAPLDASGINAALKAAMDAMYSGEVEASMGIFAPVGAATIAYWAPAMPPGGISPMPPPPPGVIPTPGTIIIDPGFSHINKIAQAWVDHWSGTSADAADPEKKAAQLVAAHKAHTDAIMGMWTGLIPGAPPVPHIANWTGIK